MSGHSKWHNIQKTKGAADAKRSAAFTKIAREIIVAVKEGGSGDPNNNSRLATVIAKAKAVNMPNDIISAVPVRIFFTFIPIFISCSRKAFCRSMQQNLSVFSCFYIMFLICTKNSILFWKKFTFHAMI